MVERSIAHGTFGTSFRTRLDPPCRIPDVGVRLSVHPKPSRSVQSLPCEEHTDFSMRTTTVSAAVGPARN
jgi:hypothetical protein